MVPSAVVCMLPMLGCCTRVLRCWAAAHNLEQPYKAKLCVCACVLQHLSHLYKNTGALVGAYLRIDIPKLPQLDQYNYVLFTGACLVEANSMACAREL